MSVRPLRHDKRCGWFSNSRGLSASVSFLSSPPPPRLLAPFFAWPLLQNSTETLDSQAKLWTEQTGVARTRHHLKFSNCLSKNEALVYLDLAQKQRNSMNAAN